MLSQLPPDARTELGPDATGVGWVFQYALVDRSGTQSLADLRSYQDWYLRYHLKAVPGVAEVASLGGFTSSIRSTSTRTACAATACRSSASSRRCAAATPRLPDG